MKIIVTLSFLALGKEEKTQVEADNCEQYCVSFLFVVLGGNIFFLCGSIRIIFHFFRQKPAEDDDTLKCRSVFLPLFK